MFDKLSSNTEGYREFGVSSKFGNVVDAAGDAAAAAAAASKKTAGALGDASKKAADAAGDAAKKTADAANTLKKAGATAKGAVASAKAAAAAKKAAGVVGGANDLQKKTGKAIEKSGAFKKFLKDNPKILIGTGVSAASLGIYMAVTGESNPAKALGEMAGDVLGGAAEGITGGLKEIAGGLFDSLGITPYLTYIGWGCAVTSCLCVVLIALYFIMQFKSTR